MTIISDNKRVFKVGSEVIMSPSPTGGRPIVFGSVVCVICVISCEHDNF